MKVIDLDIDKRSQCKSILTSMTLKEYRDLAKDSFDANGNFDGQRGVIKRSSAAARIRKRMQEDFLKGAIFPQVVIGILGEIDFPQVGEEFDFFGLNNNIDKSNIAIIDGMQRSNIYFDNYTNNENRQIRVEFWIATNSTQLLYRMLVLNTGQTPWNTRRQLEVIYGNLTKQISEKLFLEFPELKNDVDLMGIDDSKKRTSPGKYKKNAIIEAYLGFNTRSLKVQLKDEIAEEYQRFDMMESMDQKDNFDFFVTTIGLMCKLDFTFSKVTNCISNDAQFKKGVDIFASIPACIGFTVACAEFILGKISVIRPNDIRKQKCELLKSKLITIINKIDKETETNENFLALDVLNNMCDSMPKTKIGDEMRHLFKSAFSEMIKYDEFNEIVSLSDFWREL